MKEKESRFPISSESFQKECLDKAESMSGPSTPSETEDQFARELDAVIRNGFWREYYIARQVVDYAKENEIPLLVTGNGMYSALAYVYCITKIDPAKRGYIPEYFLSERLNRRPFFQFLTSSFAGDIRSYLKTLCGDENYSESGEVSILKLPGGDQHTEDIKIEIEIRNDPFLAYAQQSLAQKEVRISDISYNPDASVTTHPIAIGRVLSEYIEKKEEADEDIKGEKNHLISAVFDGTFDSLVRAVAVIRGCGIWKSIKENPDAPKICTRDDVYRYCLERLGDKHRSFRTMEYVREGRGVPEDEKAFLDQAFISACDGIRYLVSEGSCVETAALILTIADKEIPKQLRSDTVESLPASSYVYGRSLEGNSIPISAVPDSVGEDVIVSGKITEVSFLNMRGRYALVRIVLSDDDGNWVAAKRIVVDSRVEEMKAALPVGAGISVSGLVFYDPVESRAELSSLSGIRVR